jgi:hypothetical protein
VEAHLNGTNLLKTAINPPRGQTRHHKRLTMNEPKVNKMKKKTFTIEINHPS